MPDDNHDAIHMTNLNIRVSVSILVMRLILIDFLAVFIVGLTLFLLTGGGTNFLYYFLVDSGLFLSAFIIFSLLKLLMTIYVVLQWMNEYYEIAHDAVVHKMGIIFRRVERYSLENVRAMTVSTTFLGQLLNYGTITLFDLRMQKYLDMYLIHNPKRYVKVLDQLKPNIEFKKEDIGLPIPEED